MPFGGVGTDVVFNGAIRFFIPDNVVMVIRMPQWFLSIKLLDWQFFLINKVVYRIYSSRFESRNKRRDRPWRTF
ncbi:hypothetical protein DDZ16_06105 [Marinilabilia rubra]|uniref:Uncharacterized protein n=1 Tax=Marinilabilia rubra TaxID=2162893 RepID=A0A2U2BBQ9_9BACT|nr:hypothetical protein DDZ16_06105 [Marinilabilia rubra]